MGTVRSTRRSTKVTTRLWRCRRCRRRFANRNQSHAWGRWDLQHHFRDKPKEIRELYDAFVAAVRGIGRVIIVPEKTRIAFQVRMSFAQVTPRRKWLDGHVVLSHVALSRHFRTVQTISPKNHVHTFRITTRSDLDSEMISWLREAYAVGEQRHLRHRQDRRTLAG
jgi:hypothetical protein